MTTKVKILIILGAVIGGVVISACSVVAYDSYQKKKSEEEARREAEAIYDQWAAEYDRRRAIYEVSEADREALRAAKKASMETSGKSATLPKGWLKDSKSN